jgi:hypothetical protein
MEIIGMAVKNKERYTVYLDPDNTEYVKSFLETTKNKGGLSGLVDSYLATMANTLRVSGYQPGQKLTAAKLLKIGINGLKQQPV